MRPCWGVVLAAFLLARLSLAAVPNEPGAARSGAIEGKAVYADNGEYLERARVTVEGTALETFTDNAGNFSFPSVPSGPATLKIFYTGFSPQMTVVTVAAGQTAQHDFSLTRFQKTKDAEAGTIRLAQFVVTESKEMAGAAIAINEKRFAPNIRNVIAADEFGPIVDGNLGDLLKFVPGVTLDYVQGNANKISLNGVPNDYVPVTVNGFNMAGAEGTMGRSVELIFVSTKNLSRVEVLNSPTPESPGMALAGSINVVPRSSLERSRPIFEGSTYLLMSDNERNFRTTPGPGPRATRKIHPGFDFSYVVPVNRRFGFTVSAGSSMLFRSSDFMTATWRGAGAATNGTTFPDTTPDRPYLSSYLVRDLPREERRESAGLTLDYKLGHRDQLSLAVQVVRYDVQFNEHALIFNVNRVLPGEFSPTFTHGFAGAGDIRLVNNQRERLATSYMPTLTYRHDGSIWKAEAGLAHSRSATRFYDSEKGFFSGSTALRSGVTVSFDDNFYLRPRRITVTDPATGAIVDPYAINSYVLTAANASRTEKSYRQGDDLQRSAYANLRRYFEWRVPLTLKAGLDIRQSVRDGRGASTPFNFVGADGRASTAPVAGSDDGAAVVWDESLSRRGQGFGFPHVQWVSNDELWALYKSHPAYFTLNQDAAYRNVWTLSKHAEEVISSAYLRGDIQWLDRRLKLIGGIRAEQTNVQGEGPLTDPTGNYQRDASGKVILGSNGRPLPISTDPLTTTRLTLIDRGIHARKEYLRYFPSLNAAFNVRENLIARAAYYYSVGRPLFNQYGGGITLPDTESPATSTNRIAVSNPGIKAWTARTGRIALEYYFEPIGLLSLGAYRRDFENFFGNTVFPATPDFLSLFGLDPALYGQYDVSTQYNLPSSVRMEGLELNYKQVLGFLPGWARGIQVFANASAQRTTGDATANFAGFVPRTYNWGLSLTREKYNLKANWNYKGRARRGLVAAGRGIDPATYNWGSKRLFIDLTGEYKLTRRFALFANLRNVNTATEDIEQANPFTPASSQLRIREDFPALWTFGIKGTF